MNKTIKKKNIKWEYSGDKFIIRNVPLNVYEDGTTSYDCDVTMKLSILKDLMENKEISNDVDFDFKGVVIDMMLDFNKIFFPTQEEKQEQEDLLDSLIKDMEDYLSSQGLSEKEINIIEKIEEKELEHLHPYQEWSSRYNLLKSGIITVEDIRNDIDEYLGGKL